MKTKKGDVKHVTLLFYQLNHDVPDKHKTHWTS